MKHTIKISLGGVAINIDEDAFALLDNYLKTLRRHLGSTPEATEIINDIEERASELLLGKINENESVTIDMVQQVIDTLGRPEQIVYGTDDQDQQQTSQPSGPSVKKRLYRDPDNSIIAGVAGGLGTYFGVDPIIFRIVFAVLLFAHGFGLIAYIVLWIAVPRAETPRQKLEMRGEPINLENLEKNIKKEYEEVKKNLNKQSTSEAASKGISLLSRFFLALGQIFEVFAKVVGIIIGIALISIALLALIGTIGSLFLGGLAIATLFPSFSGLSFGEFLGSTIDLGSLAWISIPVFLIIAIPLISLIYLGIRILFRFRSTDGVFGSIAASLWILAVVTLAVVVFLQARSFTIRETAIDTISLTPITPATNTIYVKALEDDDDSLVFTKESISIDDYSLAVIDGETLIYSKPRVTIGKSTSENFEMFIKRKARGATTSNASKNAQSIDVEYVFSDSTLTISPYFTLPKGEKWRMQEVTISINIPEGKRISIDANMEPLLSSTQEMCYCWPDEMVGKTWTMGKDRMVED